jgi:hypothetical protein
MPKFDAELSPDDIDILARWLVAATRGEPYAPSP